MNPSTAKTHVGRSRALLQEGAITACRQRQAAPDMTAHALLARQPPIPCDEIGTVEHDGNLAIARACRMTVERDQRIAQPARRRGPILGIPDVSPRQDGPKCGEMPASLAGGLQAAHHQGKTNGAGGDVGAIDDELQGGPLGPQHHVLATARIDEDVLKTGQRRDENAHLSCHAGGGRQGRGGKRRCTDFG
jgi:hypothetical protein